MGCRPSTIGHRENWRHYCVMPPTHGYPSSFLAYRRDNALALIFVRRNLHGYFISHRIFNKEVSLGNRAHIRHPLTTTRVGSSNEETLRQYLERRIRLVHRNGNMPTPIVDSFPRISGFFEDAKFAHPTSLGYFMCGFPFCFRLPLGALAVR